MKVLIITYCFGRDKGQSLIGSYKRSLRIALELVARNHEVFIFCTGRQFYQDELTRRAEQVVRYVEFPYGTNANDALTNRDVFLESLKSLQPDVVVVGDAPLSGTLLESTLCSAELKIPVVIIDNEYFPGFAHYFSEIHGPIADGIILSGPSSFHTKNIPSIVCQVPPFTSGSASQARNFLRHSLSIRDGKLITVLAYDKSVEQLGFSILKKLTTKNIRMLFLTANVEQCQATLETLPGDLANCVEVIAPPEESLFFGLLEISKLVIGKIAYMQVVESLVLKTPFIGVYFDGYFAVGDLPPICHNYVHATSYLDGDTETLEAAEYFLNSDLKLISQIHLGELNAATSVVDYLENMPSRPRENVTSECEKQGFKRQIVKSALMSAHHDDTIHLDSIRSTLVRSFPECRIYTLLCWYTVNGESKISRLRAIVYSSRKTAQKDYRFAKTASTQRSPYYYSRWRRLLIEKELGEVGLPPCISAATSSKEAEVH